MSQKKELVLVWALKAMPSLVQLLNFPVPIYYLWNSDVNFWFCHKEDFDNELVNVKAVQFSKLVVSWRSVSSRSADYLDSYLLTSFLIKITHAQGPHIFFWWSSRMVNVLMTLYHTHSISQTWLNGLEGIFLFGVPALLNPACPRPCCVVTTGHTSWLRLGKWGEKCFSWLSEVISGKAEILVQVLWHPAPGPTELVLAPQGFLKSGQTRMKLSIVSYFALSRCRSTLLPRVDAAAARTGVAHCLLATSGDVTLLAPLAGWLRLREQCQKAHFCVLGRKWSPWDERGSDHTCTDPELQFCTVAGAMSLMRPQKMSHVLLVIKVFPMHWAA